MVSVVESRAPDNAGTRLVLPSLVLSRFASITPIQVLNLLLVDIAASFGSSVGMAGQLQAASSTVSLVGALLVAAVSVRFRSASLLFTGLALLALSALGVYLAPSLQVMLVFYALSGLANSIIPPMSSTLVGERFAPGLRSHAMGWLTAGMSLAGIVGPPIVSAVSSLWGWRLVFLAYAFPLFLVTLLLSAVALRDGGAPKATASSMLEGFKAIFSSRSAVSCLVGYALACAAYMAIMLYAASFYRQGFLLSSGVVSVVVLVGAVFSALGAFAGGHLVNRFGRKPVSAASAVAAGVPIMFFTNLANPWASIGAMYLGRFFMSVLVISVTLLLLDQVPRFRGSMMSISSAASSLGSTLGAMTGGWVLMAYGYGLIGTVLGGVMLLAAVVFKLLSVDVVKSDGTGTA